MKKFKKQAEDEIKALDELKKYIFNVPDIGPLMKSLLRESIIGHQEILRDAWGVEIETINYFNISDGNLRLYEIQMQVESGGWVRVGHGGFGMMPDDVTIRLERDGKFFEANGKTEFLLSASPILIDDTDLWSINYQ